MFSELTGFLLFFVIASLLLGRSGSGRCRVAVVLVTLFRITRDKSGVKGVHLQVLQFDLDYLLVCDVLRKLRGTLQFNVTCYHSSRLKRTGASPVTLSGGCAAAMHSGVAMATIDTTLRHINNGHTQIRPRRSQSRTLAAVTKKLANHSSHFHFDRKTCRSRSAERGRTQEGASVC